MPEKISTTVGRFEMADVTLAWIRNTMELSYLALSENLRSQIEADPQLEIAGGPLEVPFGDDGDLISPFAPHEAHA